MRSNGIKLFGTSVFALFFLISLSAMLPFFNLDHFSFPKASCLSTTSSVFGEIVHVNNPVPAIMIGKDVIPVGEAQTYSYLLKEDSKYHIYLVGEWTNPKKHNTDYDIYVYQVTGSKADLISSHTESAGLPEQIGNDGSGQYFSPKNTGTYYFNIRNDALESTGSETATFLVIEQIEPNRWISQYMKGKVNDKPSDKIHWSYEFISSADRIRINVDVPESLDMYEVRLYLMANPEAKKGNLLRGIPVAWEPGLRGKLSGKYGGFNFEPTGFRHLDAMDSCEFYGEDMVIDYVMPINSEVLYHLVLIAEYGSGEIDFVVQTDFDSPIPQLIGNYDRVAAEEPTKLKIRVLDEFEIKDVSLVYSKDNGEAWSTRTVSLDEDGNYTSVLPAFEPGTWVTYAIEAEDMMGNTGFINGSYLAVGKSNLEIELKDDVVEGGEVVNLSGMLQPGGNDVNVTYIQGEETFSYVLLTDDTGLFEHSFKPMSKGLWNVFAEYHGSEDYLSYRTDTLNFTVLSKSLELTCDVKREKVELMNMIRLSGEIGHEIEGVPVEISVDGSNGTKKILVETDKSGIYRGRIRAESKGALEVGSRVYSDGLVYDDAVSETVEINVVDPSLTTRLVRLPGAIANKAGGVLKPPYLYGMLALIGVASGGIVYYFRFRE